MTSPAPAGQAASPSAPSATCGDRVRDGVRRTAAAMRAAEPPSCTGDAVATGGCPLGRAATGAARRWLRTMRSMIHAASGLIAVDEPLQLGQVAIVDGDVDHVELLARRRAPRTA